jgi:hypothetical protein
MRYLNAVSFQTQSILRAVIVCWQRIEISKVQNALCTAVFQSVAAQRTNLLTLVSDACTSTQLSQIIQHNHSIIFCESKADHPLSSSPLQFNRVSAGLHSRSVRRTLRVCAHWLLQILRWNWSRVILALSFARSVASMAFALRYSVLPLIDTIVHFAFEKGIEGQPRHFTRLTSKQEYEIERSAISLQRFSRTRYFEVESQRKRNAHIRKTPDT